jgi:RimJ/RimL family protein N-acetyltransferase
VAAGAAHDVSLREIEDDDIAVFFRHQSDPVATAMAAFPARDEARFAAHWARSRANATAIMRAVVADGALAGNIVSWEQHGQRLIGYWLGREHWGRGIATRAVRAFLTEVPTRPLYAHVAAHNAGSIRVLEKAGFRRDHVQEAEAPAPDDGVQEFIFVVDR